MADNNLQLEKTLQVDGQTYDINAVQADKVANKLTVNKIKLGDKGKTTADTLVLDFDGNFQKTLNVVPTDGGRFSGRITVPSYPSTWEGDPETVLNYNDIQNTVLAQLINTSVLYSWSGTRLTPTIDAAIAGISIITGKEEHIDELIAYSGVKPTGYLYICSDSGNIYFCAGSTSKQVATSVKQSYFNVNLGSTTSASFTGHEGSTSSKPINIGVTGKLPIEHGGTNATTKADAADNLITGQTIKPAKIELNNTTENGLWMTTGKYGLDMANSDMVNLNGLFFSDASNGPGEGLNFIRTRNEEDPLLNTYDRIYAYNGHIYFVPNCAIRDQDPTEYDVYHANGPTIPASKGGTGQTNLDNVTVGKSKTVKVSYKASTSATAADKYANIKIEPSASYPKGPNGENGSGAATGNDGDILILF